MKKTGAYFTVEAAMVFPIVFGVVILVIYLMLFQYDRCLMEQSAGVLAMRGCTLQITDKEELARELMTQSQKADVSKYLAFSLGKAQIVLKGEHVTVSRDGALIFPFGGLVPGNAQGVWNSKITFENNRISPVVFVRNCRKIMGGK